MFYKTFTAKMINIILLVLIHSTFCNFMLLASSPNFTEVFRNTQYVVQVWFREWRRRVN